MQETFFFSMELHVLTLIREISHFRKNENNKFKTK